MAIALAEGFGAFPENSPAGKRFKEGWDNFVERQKLGDVFWDPVDQRWETYPPARFTFALVGMPKVTVGDKYWIEKEMLKEVLELGRATRALNAKVIWGPRNGQWYSWAHKAAPPPPPPPRHGWLDRLNADLDALDANSRLTPQERADARRAIIASAYGNR